MDRPQVTPEEIFRLALGFWASKTLLSAVELGVFTALGQGPADAPALTSGLGLHERGARDFLDALVALGMLERDAAGRYSNTAATGTFLDKGQPSYLGGILEMANKRLYPFWGHLTEALRTGEPQNEVKHGLGQGGFAEFYADPERLAGFLNAMASGAVGPAMAIAANFPWAQRRSFADVGGAGGALAIQIARAHPHLTGIGFDLPPVGPIFEKNVAAAGLAGRLGFQAGDFFADPLPRADVLIMGRILHDWDLEQKRTLLRKSYEALPAGGAVIVYDAIIDDERRTNAFGLLMSLNMLIETPGGFDYTGADVIGWMKQAGFREARVEPLVGFDSMAVGIK